MISVASLGVAAKRGEDPTVDGSHGREEGVASKMMTAMSTMRGGGETGAPPSHHHPLFL